MSFLSIYVSLLLGNNISTSNFSSGQHEVKGEDHSGVDDMEMNTASNGNGSSPMEPIISPLDTDPGMTMCV